MNSTQEAKDQTKGALGIGEGYWSSNSINDKPAALDYRPGAYRPPSKPAIERFNSNLRLENLKFGFSTALNLGSKRRQNLVNEIHWERT
jgi:hypothetical protein